jgi:hypothetical protein
MKRKVTYATEIPWFSWTECNGGCKVMVFMCTKQTFICGTSGNTFLMFIYSNERRMKESFKMSPLKSCLATWNLILWESWKKLFCKMEFLHRNLIRSSNKITFPQNFSTGRKAVLLHNCLTLFSWCLEKAHLLGYTINSQYFTESESVLLCSQEPIPLNQMNPILTPFLLL